MPIYEYRCVDCGTEFEEWQKITEPPVDKCKKCGGRASRLISHTSFVLKGTGWYVTDYARKDGSSSPPPSTTSASSSDSKKSDSAAAAD
jgi:putative FmdB family regulatory protein